jgi:hypothetical protein
MRCGSSGVYIYFPGGTAVAEDIGIVGLPAS